LGSEACDVIVIMNNEIINNIIREKIPCFFISPHLDDAALSAGGLIAYLSQHTHVEVIDVFTEAKTLYAFCKGFPSAMWICR